MKFALDRNKNREIEKDEVVEKFSDLASEDTDGNGALNGRELNDVYFEYGKDRFLSGGRTHRVRSENYTQYVTLNEVRLDPPAIDMHVDMRI